MATWMDLTIRPTGDPEIDVNPETGEFELSWQVPEAEGSRVTMLVPREVADRAVERIRDLLMLLPGPGR